MPWFVVSSGVRISTCGLNGSLPAVLEGAALLIKGLSSGKLSTGLLPVELVWLVGMSAAAGWLTAVVFPVGVLMLLPPVWTGSSTGWGAPVSWGCGWSFVEVLPAGRLPLLPVALVVFAVSTSAGCGLGEAAGGAAAGLGLTASCGLAAGLLAGNSMPQVGK